MKLPQSKEEIVGMSITGVFEMLCKVQAEAILRMNEYVENQYIRAYADLEPCLTREQVNFLKAVSSLK